MLTNDNETFVLHFCIIFVQQLQVYVSNYLFLIALLHVSILHIILREIILCTLKLQSNKMETVIQVVVIKI